MSHVVSIQTEVRDQVAVAAACQRLGLPAPTQGTAKLFSDQVSGLLVQLPGLALSGRHRHDSRPSQIRQLWRPLGRPAGAGSLLASVCGGRAKIEARKRGHRVTEQALADGSIKLTIQVAGGAA